MRVNSFLLLTLLAQVYVVNCQFHYHRESHQGSRRLVSGPSAPISVFPEFIPSPYNAAGSEANGEPAFRRRSSIAASHSAPVKTTVPANRRISGRPYAARESIRTRHSRPGSGPFPGLSERRQSNLRDSSLGNLSKKQPSSTRVKTEEGKETKRKTASPSLAVTPPQSLEGWVSHPTEASVAVTTKRATVADKAGQCGTTFSYGIQCAVRMDQCSQHGHCPGDTRCCMVAECGYMCVKPKAKSDGNKKRGSVSSILKRQSEREAGIEVSTTSMGLKLDDIALNVEDT